MPGGARVHTRVCKHESHARAALSELGTWHPDGKVKGQAARLLQAELFEREKKTNRHYFGRRYLVAITTFYRAERTAIRAYTCRCMSLGTSLHTCLHTSSYDLCSYGLYSRGLYSYGLYSYGLYNYGLYSYLWPI